jgi:hypothetical protein
MPSISPEEKLRRQRINESVIGTSAMEGITLDTQTLLLIRRYEDGELTREELSAAIDAHVREMLALRSKGASGLVEAGVV